MSKQERQIDTDPDNYNGTAKPIQRRQTRGNTYETTFRYTQVYMDFNPDSVFVDDAETVQHGDRVFYKYGDKPPVMVTEDGAHAHEDCTKREAQQQAFFVLSQLAEYGHVGKWTKVK